MAFKRERLREHAHSRNNAGEVALVMLKEHDGAG